MSDKPVEARFYEQKKYASNIELLINALGFQQAHEIGCISGGGWLAVGLLKYHLKVLSSLVFLRDGMLRMAFLKAQMNPWVLIHLFRTQKILLLN